MAAAVHPALRRRCRQAVDGGPVAFPELHLRLAHRGRIGATPRVAATGALEAVDGRVPVRRAAVGARADRIGADHAIRVALVTRDVDGRLAVALPPPVGTENAKEDL